ncbi:MAG: hypothetical protein E7438_02745 [Ruminococcaceae bacterium]|nr:hypothetical protein [Oscillospiraceae bacterium]
MALQPDIQYVPICYVDGSAARKLERPVYKTPAAPQPRSRKAKRIVVAIDPVAIFGLLVAMVLLISMVSGFVQYAVAQEQNRQMSDYVTALELEKAQLEQIYREGYDLDEIRDFADANGMVPAEQAPQIQIDVQLPQPEQQQMTFWESVSTFLAGLFA